MKYEDDVWLAVLEDMNARRDMGIKKYGCTVNTNDGRDSLQDAYEEQLDQVVYLKNEILKRNKTQPKFSHYNIRVAYPCGTVMFRPNVVGYVCDSDLFNGYTNRITVTYLDGTTEKLPCNWTKFEHDKIYK